MNEPRRVLVTGSRGFTGQHLRGELERRGYVVIGLSNELPVTSSELHADLADPRALAEAVREAAPHFVVHLAAISFVGHANADDFYATNVLGTRHLLHALTELPDRPARVVVASSANIYGDAAVSPITEDAPGAPRNHYAASKVAMEAMAAVYSPDLPITITRPFNYTGPGQAPHFLVPKLVSHFARRAPRIELGNLDVERDFLDVRTVAWLYGQLLETTTSQVVNLCSGRGIALGEIVAQLQRITGHTIAVEVNPAFVRPNEIKRLVGSPRRLHALVGDVPDLPFEQTLRDMLAAG